MFDIITHAQAVILRSLGETLAVIQQQTGITQRHIRNIHNEAQKRGWERGTPLTLEHVKHKDRSGRKKPTTGDMHAYSAKPLFPNRKEEKTFVSDLRIAYLIFQESEYFEEMHYWWRNTGLGTRLSQEERLGIEDVTGKLPILLNVLDKLPTQANDQGGLEEMQDLFQYLLGGLSQSREVLLMRRRILFGKIFQAGAKISYSL
ncbi:hypothetical protein EV426DRAFT_645420 [Tirmania nivea]|nr:hypothetical protein EV426DRAFT_645420 [Tirmania nivea]